MQKIRSAVKTPLSLLVLLAAMAHLAPIMLLGSSINPIRLFTSRDAYLAELGAPQFSFNFNDVADGRYNAINFGPAFITGDMFAAAGAINFGAGSSFAMNFAGGGVFAWGADIIPLGPGGFINFSVGGETASFNLVNPGFVGFATDFGFGAINANFGANPVINFSAAADGSGFILDNVIANAVPEPTTLLLLATGAGLLGASQRRRKRAEARGPDQGDGGQAI